MSKTAVAIVQSFNLPENDTTKFLEYLAERYDAKNFMPDIGHARQFLDGIGLFEGVPKNSTIKSRNSSTKRIFEKLKTMSLAELKELDYCGLYDPPKRLETYAAAIESFGRQLRRKR